MTVRPHGHKAHPSPGFAADPSVSGTALTLGQACLCIATAVLCYAVIDTVSKGLASHYAVVQILALRGGFSLLVLLPALLRPAGLARLRSRYIWLHILRGVVGVAALGLFVTAFRHMRLGDVVAIAYTAPLFVVLFARLFFHEALPWRAVCAVCLGLLGGAIVLAPSLDLVQWTAVMPLAGAICLALYIAMIKLAPAEDAIASVFYVTLVGIVVTGLPAIWHWQPVPSGHWALFLVIGLLSGLALYCRNIGYGQAPLTVTAPIEYSGILWAALFGLLWFDEQPGPGLVIGSLLLLASNVFLVVRRPAPKPAVATNFNHSKKRQNSRNGGL